MCLGSTAASADQQGRTGVRPHAEVGDLTFHLCNMSGEMVSVEGLSDSLGQQVDPGLLDEARWHTAEVWISLQRMITMG